MAIEEALSVTVALACLPVQGEKNDIPQISGVTYIYVFHMSLHLRMRAGDQHRKTVLTSESSIAGDLQYVLRSPKNLERHSLVLIEVILLYCGLLLRCYSR